MYIDDIRHYCISKKAVTESFPFNDTTLVFKVMNKIFLMAPLDKWEDGKASITVKCDPVYTDELRETFESVYAGPYVSNKHWNTLALHTYELSPKLVIELINHSYEMVVKGMTKKLRETLNSI